jgi:hypothetical protein
MRVAAVIRPEGAAPKGQESLAQGLPWVSRNKRLALNGPGKRNVPALLTGEVNETHLTEEAKRGRFAYLPVGPFSISNPEDRVLFMERTFMCLVRANRWGGITQGKPWAMLSWPLRATDWRRPNSLLS